MLPTITLEARYALGFFDQCFVVSHWISHRSRLAFGLLRLIQLPCAKGDKGNQNEVLQSQILMLVMDPIKEVGEILPLGAILNPDQCKKLCNSNHEGLLKMILIYSLIFNNSI
jgi:hypothetical protein